MGAQLNQVVKDNYLLSLRCDHNLNDTWYDKNIIINQLLIKSFISFEIISLAISLT